VGARKGAHGASGRRPAGPARRHPGGSGQGRAGLDVCRGWGPTAGAPYTAAAMARPVRFEHNRWLGDKRSMVVHDLDATVEACAIPGLLASEQFASFGPDVLAEARNRGYHACRHCAGAATA